MFVYLSLCLVEKYSRILNLGLTITPLSIIIMTIHNLSSWSLRVWGDAPMNRKTRPTFTIEHALLGFVHQQPMHGYEIYQRLKAHQILGIIWHVKQSQVYALLAKLEQEGYLASATETHGAYPPRKVYRLTDDGAIAFATWMSTPTQQWEATQSEFLAKLFFAQRANDQIASTLVERQRTVSKTWHDDLSRQIASLKPSQSPEWLILQLRLRQIAAFLDWLTRCTIHFTSPLVVQHTIAALHDSSDLELAHQFVDYVCAPAGQSILEHYGFLPASMPTPSTQTPAHEELRRLPVSPYDQSLTVFAAATLKDAFRAIAESFSTLCGGMTVNLTVAGSHYLADEIVQGAPVDVFASASPEPMHAVMRMGRVLDGSERVFARNRLVAVTPRESTMQLATLHDLAQPGLKIAFGSTATAIGQYALDLLEQAQHMGTMDAHEHQVIIQNVAFYEQDVRAVLSKVVGGEADVAIVYTSDYCGAKDATIGSLVHPVDELWIHTG